jgi:hypothetical protein
MSWHPERCPQPAGAIDPFQCPPTPSPLKGGTGIFCAKWRPWLLVCVTLAVAVVLVLITNTAVVVAYLATLMTAISVLLKALRIVGDSRKN